VRFEQTKLQCETAASRPPFFTPLLKGGNPPPQ
jgi:hypothetical protein